MKFLIIVTAIATAVLIVLLCAGCDTIEQEVRTQRTLADGTVEIQSTTSKVRAKWDAKQTIEKLRVTNGKTQSIGISGLEQETTSTNAAGAFRAAAELLKSAR